jgi:D-arginine dehydrogenase
MPRLAVVGAGIVGCMIAREIAARAPDADVTLLDQDLAGSGASRRSAGLFIPSGCTPRLRRMAAHSEEHYQKLHVDHPELPIHPLGMTVVAAESSAARLRDSYGDALSRDPQGTWNVTGCHYADVDALTQHLARDLRRQVGVREGLRVIGVQDGKVHLSTGEVLAADRIVLAPGPWVRSPAWEPLVRPLGVRVKKIVALHVERHASAHDRVVFFPDDDAFLLPLPHRGHWLFSYACPEWDVDPQLVGGLSTENIAEAHRCLRRYAPALVEHCTAGRVFCDAYSRDGEPVVRALDDAGRIVFAGAANGSGYRLAPAIAAEAADLLHLGSQS